jgi:hypothetical protein
MGAHARPQQELWGCLGFWGLQLAWGQRWHRSPSMDQNVREHPAKRAQVQGSPDLIPRPCLHGSPACHVPQQVSRAAAVASDGSFPNPHCHHCHCQQSLFSRLLAAWAAAGPQPARCPTCAGEVLQLAAGCSKTAGGVGHAWVLQAWAMWSREAALLPSSD